MGFIGEGVGSAFVGGAVLTERTRLQVVCHLALHLTTFALARELVTTGK